MVVELAFKVGPMSDGPLTEIDQPGSSQIREVDGQILNHKVGSGTDAAFIARR